ncbi:MAG: DNA repair protein RecN [Vicinamibacterales bacterium]
MLRFLSVRNLAVIERAELEFGPGLTILTGETGAGKSIVVEAVALLLGGRASPDLIRTGERQAVIQAVFDEPGGNEVILRRELTDQGRSRAFIDGALVPAGDLKALGVRLVDLHGQHDHQALLDPETHLDLLDAWTGNNIVRAETARCFAAWRKCESDLGRFRAVERDRTARMDFLTFQLAELDKVRPLPGEDEELAAARRVLASADKLQRLCRESYEALYESDTAVMTALGAIWRRVAELAGIDPKFKPHLEARDVVAAHLDELARALRTCADGIDASPERLQEVEDRLALLERLKRKHGPTLGDVITRYAAMKAELDYLKGAGERLADTEAECARARQAFLDAAGLLSKERRHAARPFAEALVAQLAELAMERTRFEVRFQDGEVPEERWSDRGVDAAEFYVSPNPGEDLRPLARIASGGELSRVMLGLKTIASTDAPGKTLVFDEVDAGIGGRVADVVGAKLQRLGERFQVICITHLPQIAAYGGTHFHIEKSVAGQRTVTTVCRLDASGRVEEIARMIGGAQISSVTRRGARELLERAKQANSAG